MNRITWLCSLSTLVLVACSGDDDNAADGITSSSSSSGNIGSSSSSGDQNASSSSSGGATSSSSSSSSSSGSVDECSAARSEAMQEQATVSAGAVSTVAGAAGPGTVIYIDASAGGAGPAATAPRVYVDLGTGARVDVSDVDARASNAWDLALKRTNVFTNDGDGGSGQGGAQRIEKPFADVVAADATAIETEEFFDEATCTLKSRVLFAGTPNEVEDPSTFDSTLESWSSYDATTHQVLLDPADPTFIVRGGQGALYKVHFESYKANADGTAGETTARFLLRVAPLQ